MKSFYRPDYGAFDAWDDSRDDISQWAMDEEMVEQVPDDPRPFHVGQSYETTPAERLRCTHCGGEQFEIAQGSFFTAIRCPKCGWEARIHEG